MDIWVQKIKTGESWLLDNDQTKEVYKMDNGGIYYKLGMWSYRFLPVDPNRPAKSAEDISIVFLTTRGRHEQKSNADNHRAGRK